MKTIYKSLVLIAAAAFALSSCAQKENLEPSEAVELMTLKFNINNADNGAETKALLGTEDGKNFLDWEDGDQIGTYSVGSFGGSSSASNNNAGTVEVSGDSYTLNVQVNPNGNITSIYSYYPHSASAGKDKTSAIVTIPESQVMNAEGFDADAMPMAGEPVEVSLTSVPANTDTPCGTINFSNLGSIINFKIYSSVATDETLTSVKYITSGNVGGAFSIDLTGVDASNESTLALTASDAVSEITTTYTTHPAIGTGKSNAIDVYMVVAPGTYSSTQVVVTTSAHTYTLTASGDKTYERSHVKPMNVDIQKGEVGDLPKSETWTKVTTSSEFTAGTYYILRGDDAYYLPNAVASSGAPACVAYFATGTIPNSMRWTATAGENGLVFESASNSGNYLWGWATNNGIRVTSSAPSAEASKEWSFNTLVVSETTYYTASAVSGRYLISYGNQDWRNYTGGNASNIPAEFYKLVDDRDDAELEWSDTEGLADITSEGVDYSLLPTLSNPHSVTISSYQSTNTSVATIASDGTITAISVGTTTIKAIFNGDSSYSPATVSYELEVTDSRTACATPTFSPTAGEVTANATVTISSSTTGSTIYYTTNGDTPEVGGATTTAGSSGTASATVTIDVAKTLKAIAVKEPSNKPSAVATASYTIAGAFTPVVFSWTQSATTSGYTFSMENGSSKSGYIQDQSGSVGLNLKLKKTDDSALFSTTPTTITLKVNVGGGSAKDPLTNNVIGYLIDSDGNNIASTATVVTNKVETTTGKEYTVTMPLVSEAYGIRISHEKESSYNVRIYGISFRAE